MSTVDKAVRDVCLHFPEAVEVESRGSPHFRVRKKTFAMYVVNHHGDGRISLWLPASPEMQSMYVDSEPEFFFVPPYVGVNGWLGLHLNRDMPWDRVGNIVEQAYLRVAPKALVESIAPLPEITPPTDIPSQEQLDPMNLPRNRKVLDRLRELCLGLPEVTEARQFGHPVFKAGKKSFCTIYPHYTQEDLLCISVWVGADRQSMLTFDERYEIPAYTGHNGWIALNIDKLLDWNEVNQLILESYRHFALKRMLKILKF